MTDSPSQPRREESGADSEFDYVIVGGGSAGCVLANRLSHDRDHRVLLLESGPKYRSWMLGIPLLSYKFVGRHKWHYRTVPQEGCNAREVALPCGRVIGGGSAVNAMLFVRGEPWCYDRWEKQGNPGWSYDDVLPYFRRSETSANGSLRYHGKSGPIHVDKVRFYTEFDDRLMAAFQELGLPVVDDFAGPSQTGVGLLDVNQKRGWRSSASNYVKEASGRDNLSVRTEAQVTRILVEGGQAVGVEYSIRGRTRSARCRREVVLSAGAIASPRLLMLSGIGPADQLRAHGIPVVLDLPGVGENLQDHIRVPVLYRGKVAFAPYPASLFQKAAVMARFLATGRGLLSSAIIAAVIAFLKVLPESRGPDCQFTPGIWGGDETGPDANSVNFEPCLIGTRSRGRVRLASADPGEPPRIDPRYLTEPSDLRTLVGGVRFARAMTRTRAFEGFLGEEIGPGPGAMSDADLEDYVRNHIETCFHPVGTCKMGRDELAVVDHRLAVRGVEGLRVVDASVMPTIINGNTNAPTLMIAEKGSDMILGKA